MNKTFRIATLSAALVTLSLSTSSLWAQDAVAAASAKEAGADEVGGAELAERILGGWLDFDMVITSPDMKGINDHPTAGGVRASATLITPLRQKVPPQSLRIASTIFQSIDWSSISEK